MKTLAEKIKDVLAMLAEREPVEDKDRLPLPLGRVELVYEGGEIARVKWMGEVREAARLRFIGLDGLDNGARYLVTYIDKQSGGRVQRSFESSDH